jgi:predicted ATPase
MITKWQVSNFKSIAEMPELELAPLTVFTGTNSSGKSTLLQSILLIAQTLAHRDTSIPLVLNGAYVNLGQFDELKTNGSNSESIDFRFSCGNLDRGGAVEDEELPFPRRLIDMAINDLSISEEREHQIKCYSFPDVKTGTPLDISFISDNRNSCPPRLFALNKKISLSREGEEEKSISIHFTNEKLKTQLWEYKNLYTGNGYSFKTVSGNSNKIKDEYKSAEEADCSFRHFLPKELHYSIDAVKEYANMVTNALKDPSIRVLWGDEEYKLHFSSYFEDDSDDFTYTANDIFFTKEIIDVIRDILIGVVDFDTEFKNRMKTLQLSGPSDDWDADYSMMVLKISDWIDWYHALPFEIRKNVDKAITGCSDLEECIFDAAMRTQEKIDNELIVYEPPRPKKKIEAKLNQIDIEIKKDWESARPRFRLLRHSVPKDLSKELLDIENLFADSVKYLGPLRENPKVLYPVVSVGDLNDVGSRGENTPAVYESKKDEEIYYYPPEVLNFEEKKRVKLSEAVSDWLRHLCVAESIVSNGLGKKGVDLGIIISNGDTPHDLTNVGVGISQVLPILVMGLLAKSNTILIFEQPELHLHPRSQSRLADFFISLARAGKQCIIETHSEYIIHGIRYHIVANDEDKGSRAIRESTRIYYAEKKENKTTFKEIKVNKLGALSESPEGFFDEALKIGDKIINESVKKLEREINTND